jgi:hypothetical protein
MNLTQKSETPELARARTFFAPSHQQKALSIRHGSMNAEDSNEFVHTNLMKLQSCPPYRLRGIAT